MGTSVSASEGLSATGIALLLYTSRKTRQSMWKQLQSGIRKQAEQDHDPWKKGNKLGKPYNSLAYFLEAVSGLTHKEGELKPKLVALTLLSLRDRPCTSNHALGHSPQRNENLHSYKNLYTNIHSSFTSSYFFSTFIFKSKILKTTQMSFNGWAVETLYIHIMEYYSAIKFIYYLSYKSYCFMQKLRWTLGA